MNPWLAVLLFLSVVVIAIEWLFHQRLAEGRTPRDLAKFYERGRRGQFDFFISYRSRNSDLARAIAEALREAGAQVWFDEYVILLAPERKRFRDEIRLGIRKSKHFICLTSKDYFRSEYCRQELEAFLEDHSPQQVLNLTLQEAQQPMDALAAKISSSPSCAFRKLSDAATLIRRATGKGISIGSQPEYLVERSPVRLKGLEFSFAFPASNRMRPSQRFSLETEHGVLTVQIDGSLNTHDARNALATAPDIDDRIAFFSQAMDRFERRHGDDKNVAECVDTHLAYSLGAPQRAVTYFFPPNWHRYYELSTPTERGTVTATVGFAYVGTFKAFCRVAPTMDRLISSAQVSTESIGDDDADASHSSTEDEYGLRLRKDAGLLRMQGDFDAAYGRYRSAYSVYRALGDVQRQCNVLCSLAETTPHREEVALFLNKIQDLIDVMDDTEERTASQRKLQELRLKLVVL